MEGDFKIQIVTKIRQQKGELREIFLARPGNVRLFQDGHIVDNPRLNLRQCTTLIKT